MQTRDGWKARIICFDYKDPVRPIIALIESTAGTKEELYYYSPNGKSDPNKPKLDLVMVKIKHKGFVNVYKDAFDNYYSDKYIYKSIQEAKNNIISSRIYIDTIEISWEE